MRVRSVVGAMFTPPCGMLTSAMRSARERADSSRSAAWRKACSPPATNDSSSTMSSTLRPRVVMAFEPNGGGSNDPPPDAVDTDTS
jgi:hypothetical protein